MSNQIDGIPCSDPMNVAMSAPPTGGATAAKQDTGNTSLASIDTKLGEVQASPTSNTVLDRLKALLTGIVLAAGNAIIGKVGIDQTTPGTTNLVALTAETTKVIGTINLAAAQTLANVTTVATVTTLTQWTAGTLVIGSGANAIGKLAANSGIDIGDVDVTSIAAGENVIGKTVGVSTIVTSTVTMSVAGAYATGDYIGTSTTPQAFTNASRVSGTGTGIIKSIRISDKNTTAAVAMELWVFSATFVAPTDNAAWAISDAEAFTCLGVIPISTSKWYASSNNKVYSDDTLALAIKPAATSLFYALVARGTTPSWTSGDLDIGLGILLD